MPNNKIYIAAAGSGKTSFIVKQALERLQNGEIGDKNILIISYTRNNQNNVVEKIEKIKGYVPKGIQVIGWYSFLLEYWIRPFKGTVIDELYDKHLGLIFVEGISGTQKLPDGRIITTYHSDIEKYVDSKKRNCFSDKMAELAHECYDKNPISLLERLENIVDTIYIDEAQDLVAWDYEIIKLLIRKTNVNCILCGDPRQHTYSSSPSTKNKKYKGNIAAFANESINTRRKLYVDIDETTLNKSHRCTSEICVFASRITSSFPATKSCDCDECKTRRENYSFRKGIYLLRNRDVERYVSMYHPMTLVWNANSKVKVRTPISLTFGLSKGLQSDATIIYPTKSILDAFKATGIFMKDVTFCKFYVAVTRAKFVAAIVVDDDYNNPYINLPFWE